MSLFNKTALSHQQSQTVLNPAEAFATITLIAIAADGYFADSEVQALSTLLNRMQLFRSYPGDVLRKMFDRLMNLLNRYGTDALTKLAVTSLPHDLKPTAFAMAADIVLADGEVTEDEEEFLNSLYSSLEISQETAIKIIDVMIIKNRG